MTFGWVNPVPESDFTLVVFLKSDQFYPVFGSILSVSDRFYPVSDRCIRIDSM